MNYIVIRFQNIRFSTVSTWYNILVEGYTRNRPAIQPIRDDFDLNTDSGYFGASFVFEVRLSAL